MINIDYPSIKVNLDILKTEYLALFANRKKRFNKKISEIKLKRKTQKNKETIALFTKYTFEDIVVGNIKTLVDFYTDLFKISSNNQKSIKKELGSIFKYDQSKISTFFEDHDNVFNLRSCHYCNMDSVHVYSVSADKKKNHFTLDHYIPQSKCCFLAISLFNFVPSCYTCNSKLKKIELLSKDNKDLHKFSPTHSDYPKTGNLEFSLITEKTINIFDYNSNNKYRLLKEIDLNVEPTENKNNRLVDVLHIKQRYSIYKEKAVRLAYLKEKYSDKTIAEIANTLSKVGVTQTDVKNDIFNYPIHKNDSFSKLHEDIMKQVGIRIKKKS